jgi:hypothetical protein
MKGGMIGIFCQEREEGMRTGGLYFESSTLLAEKPSECVHPSGPVKPKRKRITKASEADQSHPMMRAFFLIVKCGQISILFFLAAAPQERELRFV